LGTFWVPKKDGFYEHPANTFEYALLNFVRAIPVGTAAQPKAHERHLLESSLKQAVEARRALAKAQRDTHPEDGPRGRRVALARPMGGYRRSFY
jgi:hypothetical protein